MSPRTPPAPWSGNFPSKLALLIALMLTIYSVGIELTCFSKTLLDDPRVRVPFFASAWTMISLLLLEVAQEGAGKGSWTAFAARALTPCACVSGLCVATQGGDHMDGWIGLVWRIFTLWSIFWSIYAKFNHLAFRLFGVAGCPIFMFTHLRLISMDCLTPAMFWLVPVDDDSRGKLRMSIALGFCFFSVILFTCVSSTISRSPRHLAHQHPSVATTQNGKVCNAIKAALSTPMMLALAGAAVAIMYQNIFAGIGIASSHQPFEPVIATGPEGPERHVLAQWQQQPQPPPFRWQRNATDTDNYQRDPTQVARHAEHVPHAAKEYMLPTDRTALWGVLQGVFASFLVSTVLVMYNASQHTEIDSWLTTDSAALEEVSYVFLVVTSGPALSCLRGLRIEDGWHGQVPYIPVHVEATSMLWMENQLATR